MFKCAGFFVIFVCVSTEQLMKRKKKTSKGRRVGLQVVTLCISTGLVLILLGLVVFTGLTAHNLSKYVKENLTVTLMFAANTSDQQAKVVCYKIQKKRYVSHLEFISRTQALKEQTEALGADPSEFLGENPFTHSAEVYLKAECANADSLKWIIKELKAYRQVEEVTYQQDLMDSVNDNIRKIMFILIALAVLLTFVSFTLINNTVRLSVYARRFAINTMKLVGASWSFIRAPFIRMGIMEGFLAAILADVVLAGCFMGLYNYEPDIMNVVTVETLAITAVSVLLFGILITTCCVYFSVNRFLRMKANDLYKL